MSKMMIRRWAAHCKRQTIMESKRVAFVLLIAIVLVSCAPAKQVAPATAELSIATAPPPIDTPIRTPTNLPPASPTPAPTRAYQPAFGIDYAHPSTYTSQGKQTVIKDTSALDSLLQKERNNIGADFPMLGEIYRWEKAGFSLCVGGKTIGVVTVEQLLQERRMGGCHDWALVYAAAARQLGYPAVIVDTMSIAWAKDYVSGKKTSYFGHVFVEVYADGKWLLVDPTNNWVAADGYDPANPVIPLKGSIAGENNEGYGFYVMCKGLDSWDYDIHSNADLQELMRNTADQVSLSSLSYPAYRFTRFGP